MRLYLLGFLRLRCTLKSNGRGPAGKTRAKVYIQTGRRLEAINIRMDDRIAEQVEIKVVLEQRVGERVYREDYHDAN